MAFSVIRYELLNPMPVAAKKRAMMAADFANSRSNFTKIEAIAGSATLFSFPIAFAYPILGGLYAFFNIAATLGAHEVKVVMKNSEELFGGSFLTRLNAVRSSTQFSNTLLKDTLVTKRLFAPMITHMFIQT